MNIFGWLDYLEERYQIEEYNRLHALWRKKVERTEKNPKRM